jgi:hypothetical protein
LGIRDGAEDKQKEECQKEMNLGGDETLPIRYRRLGKDTNCFNKLRKHKFLESLVNESEQRRGEQSQDEPQSHRRLIGEECSQALIQQMLSL